MTFSTNTHLRLEQVDATSFAGLHSDQNDPSLVITFPEAADNKNATVFEGDQGTGKTSMLECLKFIFTGDEPDNAINSDTNDKKVKAVFVDSDGSKKYIIRATKTGYSIEKVEMVNGKEEKSAVKSPKNWLRDKIGPVGIDPSFIKRMTPEDQVNWVRSLMQLTPEIAKKEKELTVYMDSASKKRREIGRTMKSEKTALIASGYFKVSDSDKKTIVPTELFTQDAIKYSEDVNEKNARIKEEYDAAKERVHLKNLMFTDLNKVKDTIHYNNGEIERLKMLIKCLEEKNVELQEKQEKLNVDIEGMGNVDQQYESASAEMQSLTEYVVNKTKFEAIERSKDNFYQLFELWKEYNEGLDKADENKRKLILDITPDIPGFEVCIPQDIDLQEEMDNFREQNENPTIEQEDAFKKSLELKKRAGIFYNGKSVSQLCESELWSLCTMIWKYQHVPVIFIENYSSLGTDAIETLNKFLEAGGQVFATLMNREQKSMKISFNTKLK